MVRVVNLLETALRSIVADLQREGAEWAIVGGLAVSARAEPRTTRDVDVVVAVANDAEAERLVRSLQSCGYRVHTLVEHDAAKRLATARIVHSERANLLVDLLFASSGIESEIVDQAEPIEILQGLTAPIARTGHLVALKVLARDDRARPQDWDDIQALLAEADDSDIKDARAAVRLIEERGFARGRALRQQLEDILTSRRQPSPK